jgi:thiosulfate/3-mercaptopyruvate sulfurtransferase
MRSRSTIISANEVFNHLQDPRWVVVDCRFELNDPAWGFEEYQRGHIPGAVYADLEKDLSAPVTEQTGRHPLPAPEQFIHKLESWGIDLHKQVVVYDHAAGAYASRLWWLLRTYGHESVAVLDGGIQAWINAGYPLVPGIETAAPAVFDGYPDPNQWVTTREVELLFNDPSFILIDARAPERFRGEQEPIDSVAGHIPGAVNRFYGENTSDDGYFLPGETLRKEFEALMEDLPPDHIIVYCGSGVTSCHNILAMEIAGLYGARLYAGSWSEWIRDPKRPIETGG